MNGVSSVCSGKSCTIRVPVSSDFFVMDRPSSFDVVGNIRAVSEQNRQLRATTREVESGFEFHLLVHLKSTMTPSNSSLKGSGKMAQEGGTNQVWLFWLLLVLSLVIVSLLAAAKFQHRRQATLSRSDEQRQSEERWEEGQFNS